jgi:hypothetical protein
MDDEVPRMETFHETMWDIGGPGGNVHDGVMLNLFRRVGSVPRRSIVAKQVVEGELRHRLQEEK